MELRQCRYFISVAKLGSISQAAVELHIAQPALTRQIQKLEEDLRVMLFKRTGRGVQLTDAGSQFLIDAEILIDNVTVIKERAIRASRGECGNISLALPVIQNAAPPITALLKKFKKTSPLVGITLHHLISEVQLSKIAEGDLDAGFLLFRPLNDPLFAGIPVFKEKMLLAYPAEWKWPDNKEPRYLRDLQNLDFIWLPRTAAPAWHDRLIHCFYDAGFTPRSVMHGVDAVSMLTLVSAGMGCTIVAEGIRHLAPPNVSFVALEDLNLVQEWELVWRKDRCSEVLKSLINLI
ncbi:DNA-binding transcriptional regulator, LysR family [Klebsiella quasipneumoniae]|uniref:LysR family transcriptional regulator n=1 Tax=Klebsiella quasipneumoniae TaxID=1463165 RepID=UPI0008712894|nr:LysR family transcriptional regulator [Klebsiella quasipneumoniae]SCW37620.1 DNA-binding transcriptional regulator, LysR family [Klebsiella quasipneumoniae]SCX46557.1 DNA-binding transcriptional regulator, LysR family [Klebsiella quasipneumoniae]SCX49389.1 DNA-binding transcriptional regulator, LysR family [Klebsiella quasipneumoniae]SCY00609.1 DNA-binding transcriptional regulator, LysR family [Klebsiella quasipneumoniae]SCY07088.1 DNA-binding transcriptional regulator, LysR family [Klebsi